MKPKRKKGHPGTSSQLAGALLALTSSDDWGATSFQVDQQSPPPLYVLNPPLFTLMLSMLQQALRDLALAVVLAPTNASRRFPNAISARAWVLNTSTPGDYPFSFESVCHELGISASAVRKILWERSMLNWERLRPNLKILTRHRRLRCYGPRVFCPSGKNPRSASL